MPKTSDKVRVEINDTTENAERVWAIEVRAEAELFRLSDELAKRGLLRGLETQLRAEVKRVVTEYIAAADNILNSVKAPTGRGRGKAGKEAS